MSFSGTVSSISIHTTAYVIITINVVSNVSKNDNNNNDDDDNNNNDDNDDDDTCS